MKMKFYIDLLEKDPIYKARFENLMERKVVKY